MEKCIQIEGEFFDRKYLPKIQSSVVAICKKSSEFKKEVSSSGGFTCWYENGVGASCDPDSNFSKEDTLACMEGIPEELLSLENDDLGCWWAITKNIKYDFNVIGGIISGFLERSSNGLVSSIFVESDIEYPNYGDFAPSLFDQVHKWSKPLDSKGFGQFLNSALSEKESGFRESLTHIYMEGENMVWEIYGSWLEKTKSVVGGESSIKHLDESAKTLMNYLDKLGKPIKEIFVIKNCKDKMVGKFISRKCSDGEYVLTVY